MDTLVLNTDQGTLTLNDRQSAIIRTLLYFGIFNYPLTVQEVHQNCQEIKLSLSETKAELDMLMIEERISCFNNFYFITGDKTQVERRIRGNELARQYLLKAKRYTRIISCFPFVEAVFLSGSLSKDFADEQSDIDYFIITRPGRLWLCRTLLVAFKKIFLFNSHKYFCVNYFVDSDNLEIPDKNIFTATELAFVKPVYNKDLCEKFFRANQWIDQLYPNKAAADLSKLRSENKNLLKKSAEFIFSRKLGEKMDEWCFSLRLRYLKKKFAGFDESIFDLNMRSRKDVSKHHPTGFQLRVLKAHNKAISSFERNFNLQLSL